MNYKLLYQLETEENHKLKALVKHLLNENQTLAIRLKHAKQPITLISILNLKVFHAN